jgi:hypothetical protein
LSIFFPHQRPASAASEIRLKQSDLIPTFSVVIHFTSISQDYASPTGERENVALNGNYWGLNGLALGDRLVGIL